MAECILREAELDDVDAIFALTRMKGVKEALPGVMKTWLEHDIGQRLNGSQRHHLIIAEIDGALVGYTRFLHRLRPEKDGQWQTTGHETAVHPEFRHQGIGRMLTDARLANTLAHDGGKQGYIAFTAPADISANHFHQAQGATIVATDADTKRSLHHYRLALAPFRGQNETRIIPAQGLQR